jgi:hypothetical protein
MTWCQPRIQASSPAQLRAVPALASGPTERELRQPSWIDVRQARAHAELWESRFGRATLLRVRISRGPPLTSRGLVVFVFAAPL